MKKFFALLLCLTMVLSMVACGAIKKTEDDAAKDNKETTTENASTEEPTSEEPTSEDIASEDVPETEEVAENNGSGDEMSLTEIMDTLYNGYNEELPMLATTEITDAETFEWITFAKYVEGYEAAVSEPMMSSIAHSVVLVRVPEGTDVESVRAEIEGNCDPRKWVCVEAEKVAVIANNNTILLVMSSAALTDIVTANFNALWA